MSTPIEVHPPAKDPEIRQRVDLTEMKLPDNIRKQLNEKIQATVKEIHAQNLSSEKQQQELDNRLAPVGQWAHTQSGEWGRMQRYLSRETLDYINDIARSPRSLEQLFEMSLILNGRPDLFNSTLELSQSDINHWVKTINQWVEVQRIMDADPGMRARFEKLEAADILKLLDGISQLFDESKKLSSKDIADAIKSIYQWFDKQKLAMDGSSTSWMHEHIEQLTYSDLYKLLKSIQVAAEKQYVNQEPLLEKYPLPLGLQEASARYQREIQERFTPEFLAEIRKENPNLSPKQEQEALKQKLVAVRNPYRERSDEWVEMQRLHLPGQTLNYVSDQARSPRSLEQLLEMSLLLNRNSDRAHRPQEHFQRVREMVIQWVEVQRIMDVDAGMRARVEKNLETSDLLELFQMRSIKELNQWVERHRGAGANGNKLQFSDLLEPFQTRFTRENKQAAELHQKMDAISAGDGARGNKLQAGDLLGLHDGVLKAQQQYKDLPRLRPSQIPMERLLSPPKRDNVKRDKSIDKDRILPYALQDSSEKEDQKRNAEFQQQILKEMKEKKLDPHADEKAIIQQELNKKIAEGRRPVRALNYEWTLMQRYLPKEMLDVINANDGTCSAKSLKQLLEMGVFTRGRSANGTVSPENVEMARKTVEQWLKLQKILGPNNAKNEMRARVEKLKTDTIQTMLNGTLPIEDLLDKRDKKQKPFLEKGDIDKLLPLVLSAVELKHLDVMKAKQERRIEALRQSSSVEDQELAKLLRDPENKTGVLDTMDPGTYYNMLLGRISPHELRIAIPNKANRVIWELVRTTYLMKEDVRQILTGSELQQWEISNAQWEKKIEPQKHELDRQWQTMMDTFYSKKPETYERLSFLSGEEFAEVRYHLMSINLSPDHEILTLRGHLAQVIAALHPDDLYPFLQHRTEKFYIPGPDLKKMAHWLSYLEIVHLLHVDLDTSEVACAGMDFYTGLPLYSPKRFSGMPLGRPRGGKTELVYAYIVQMQNSKMAVLQIDPKTDSEAWVKMFLEAYNLGEVTALTAGALGRDHRLLIIGPEPGQGSINIIWYIPTAKEAENKVKQLEERINAINKSIPQNEQSKKTVKLLEDLNRERKEAMVDLENLPALQHRIAEIAGKAWGKALFKKIELENMSHDSAGYDKFYFNMLAAAMLHLRVTNDDLPPLSALRTILGTDEDLKKLAGSPSKFVRDVYKDFQELDPEARQKLRRLFNASCLQLANEDVDNFTRTNSLDIEALLRPEEGKDPWAVYINMHTSKVKPELLAPVFESAFEVWMELIKIAKGKSDAFSNKLLISLDEGAFLAKNSSGGEMVPKLVEGINLLGSQGITYYLSTQSPPNPDDPLPLFPPNLLEKVTVYAVAVDKDTARWFEEALGTTIRELPNQTIATRSMRSQQNGRQQPTLGFNAMNVTKEEWGTVLQQMHGVTGQPTPLVYAVQLKNLPWGMGLMAVPGFAPALYIPLTARNSKVLKSLRRLEPKPEGPVVNAYTPKDMADQLSMQPSRKDRIGAITDFYNQDIDQAPEELETLPDMVQKLDELKEAHKFIEEVLVAEQMEKQEAEIVLLSMETVIVQLQERIDKERERSKAENEAVSLVPVA